MPFYGRSYRDAAWPQLDELTYCSYCSRRHRLGATACEGCGAPVTKQPVTQRTRWSDSDDVLPLLGPRLDADTGRPIGPEEWDRHEWVDVTTLGDASPRYIRTRVR